jgi:hypothetical protein
MRRHCVEGVTLARELRRFAVGRDNDSPCTGPALYGLQIPAVARSCPPVRSVLAENLANSDTIPTFR